MADGFKEYRSVSEFPLHIQTLAREELEASYQDIREEYKRLSISRGQLVRRQTEAKAKVKTLRHSLVNVSSALDTLSQDKETLQKTLAHSVQLQGSIRTERDQLSTSVRDLKQQLNATTTLLDEFEDVYEEVKDIRGISGFWRLLQAAKRLLTTDISQLTMKRANVVNDDDDDNDFLKEDRASINRSLLDNRGKPVGRLTDSLKKASEKLSNIDIGIDKMASLSEELAKNTANVADASLKLGYDYAKAEVEETLDTSASGQTIEDVSDASFELATLRQQLKAIQYSQSSLQTGNDLYRLQRALVIQYLQEQNIEPAVLKQVEQIFKLRSIKQAPTLADKILKLSPTQVLRLLRKQLTYRKHLLSDET